MSTNKWTKQTIYCYYNPSCIGCGIADICENTRANAYNRIKPIRLKIIELVAMYGIPKREPSEVANG